MPVAFDQPVAAGASFKLKLSVSAFLCQTTLCEVHSYVWNIPITVAEDASNVIRVTTPK